MSPLGKQVHKMYSSEYIERCKYSLICFFSFSFYGTQGTKMVLQAIHCFYETNSVK